MNFTKAAVPYRETGFFSPLVSDYLDGVPQLREFYEFAPDAEGFRQAIAARKSFPVDRSGLADVLQEQYRGFKMHPAATANLEALKSENCFTICTAHQPNLFTGYLYFVYKILHAVKLAASLKEKFPDHHFVPVYYMGSEDNDLDELGTFVLDGQRYRWDAGGQQGAVGRMEPRQLQSLITETMGRMDRRAPHLAELEELLRAAYAHPTIGSATAYLVNQLFGRYGLIVLDPDHPALKRSFMPVMRTELIDQSSAAAVEAQIKKLGEHYKTQAAPREINLFFLEDGLRERIVRTKDGFGLADGSRQFSDEELLRLLETNPEKFSPNVILRGLFQETILPDIAFIGGGSEVAYWLQLKPLFEQEGVFFPALVLRQSALIAPQRAMPVSWQMLFRSPDALTRDYLKQESEDWQLGNAASGIDALFVEVRQKAMALDPTLEKAAGASLHRIREELKKLEQKMFRAKKKQQSIALEKLMRIRAELFPGGGLQERVDNMLPYYARFGPDFFELLLDSFDPFDPRFLVLSVSNPH